MYKLMIVDDDSIIRRGLCDIIDWEKYGFEIVGAYGDGELALSEFAVKRPNILISDIKMPFMDGLELISKVNDAYPDVITILLSAYEEFEYAKRAIKNKAFDYLIKPVETQTLLKVVMAAAEEYDRRNKIRDQLTASKEILRERFFCNLLMGLYSENEIKYHSKFYDVDCSPGDMAVFFVKISDSADPGRNSKTSNNEILKYGIRNILSELLNEKYTAYILDWNIDEIVVVCLSSGEDEAAFTESTQRILEEARDKVDKNLQCTITVGVSNVCHKLPELCRSYKQSGIAIGFSHILGNNRLLCYNKIRLPETRLKNQLQEWDSCLIDQIILGKKDEAFSVLDDLEKQLNEQFASMDSVHYLCIEIIVLLFRETLDWDDFRSKFGSCYNYYSLIEQILNTRTISGSFKVLRDFADSVCNYAISSKYSSKQAAVAAAKKYVEDNYAKVGLSLNEVSAYVHVSPTYLSNLFKQVGEINFSDYLLEIRMKSAVRLLNESNLKLYEVAEKVGYNNANYFSSSFRKYFGVSPSSYQSSQTESCHDHV